jgi:hypothetical protein
VIVNFKQLLKDGVIAYSNRMTNNQKALIKNSHKGQTKLAIFVDPCADKTAVLEKEAKRKKLRRTLLFLCAGDDEEDEEECDKE